MLLLALLACAPTPSTQGPPSAVDLSPLSLSWAPAATGLDPARLRTGLDWNLSLLGALPPADGAHLVIEPGEPLWSITLDPAAAAFPEASRPALTDALAELRAHVDTAGSIDLGRLFMLTLHEPWRYYAITGACSDALEFRLSHLPADTDRYDVVMSQLTSGDRIVHLPPDGHPIEELSFLVVSSTQEIDDGFLPEEFETLDLMDNGQQRFAAYDEYGRLHPFGDPEIAPAGQPGRCHWCHEGHLMAGTPKNPSTNAALSTESWFARMEAWQQELDAWRATLPTAVDFIDPEAHTQGELVVREFLLPTVDRVAAEWGTDEAQARAALVQAGAWLGQDEEWPDRGEVALRAEVDALTEAWTGLAPVPVLPDARELSGEEALRGEDWAAWMRCGS